MKYLKSINEISHLWHNLSGKKPVLPDEVIQTIKDICLELNDNGFKVFTNQLGFNKLGKREGFYPNITIFNNILFTRAEQRKDYFKYSEIEEVVNRLTDYMASMGYKVKIDKTMGDVSNGLVVRKELKEVNIKFI